MKYFRVVSFLMLRNIKFLIFYLPMLPFFFMRLIGLSTCKIKMSLLNKFMSVAVGEIWMFGKNKIDFRDIYENQRRLTVEEFTAANLLFFIPGQWFTLSPLETALSILLSPIDKTIIQKILFIPYAYYLILFDESRHSVKANHGIGCALALSVIFKSNPKIARYYYFRAIMILRTNSNYFFYDEGSTNYHIFVTSLLKNYFYLMKRTPFWFKGYERISDQLLSCRQYFFFGDDDRSAWLYDVRGADTHRKTAGITHLIGDHQFRKSIIDRYFKVYTRNSVTLLVCVNGSDWGHAHYMIGSILYFIEDELCVGFQRNSYYTLDAPTRQRERLFSCNSPVEPNFETSLGLAFFKRVPKSLTVVKEYSERDCQISISGHGWCRHIDFRKKRLKVVDTGKDGQVLQSSFSVNGSPYIDYSY